MNLKSIFTLISLVSLFQLTACGQTPSNPKKKSLVFKGSIPCDDFIRTKMLVPATDSCEFMKWELTLATSSEYSLKVMYGQSQPNTNGFINDGRLMLLDGKYTRYHDPVSGREMIYLTKTNNGSKITIVQLAPTILHLADDKGKLLVGNGGFGYVLNEQPL